MGAASSSSKALNVPSLPGTAKSNNDHSSVNEFCTGVPLSKYLLGVLSCLHNLVMEASGFLIFWPSSSTTQPQAFASKASDNRLKPSYEDRTTPTVAPLTEGGDNALAKNSAKGAGPRLAACIEGRRAPMQDHDPRARRPILQVRAASARASSSAPRLNKCGTPACPPPHRETPPPGPSCRGPSRRRRRRPPDSASKSQSQPTALL